MTRVWALALALVATQGFAATDAEKAAETALSGGALKAANIACGTNVTVSIDWASFDAAFDGVNDAAAAATACGHALEALRDTCRKDEGKAAVAGAVKSVTCGFKEPVKKLVPSLEGGVLGLKFDWHTPSIFGETKELLIKKLGLPEKPR